jgi:HSP20 family molecular chaperone IbpA
MRTVILMSTMEGTVDEFDREGYAYWLSAILPDVQPDDIEVIVRAASVVVEARITVSSMEVARNVQAKLNIFAETSNGIEVLSKALGMKVQTVQTASIHEQYIFLPSLPPMPPRPEITDEWVVLQSTAATSAALLMVAIPILLCVYGCCLMRSRKDQRSRDKKPPPGGPIFPHANRRTKSRWLWPFRRDAPRTCSHVRPCAHATAGKAPVSPPFANLYGGVNLSEMFEQVAEDSLSDFDDEQEDRMGKIRIGISDRTPSITIAELQERIRVLEAGAMDDSPPMQTIPSSTQLPEPGLGGATYSAPIKLSESHPRKVRVRVKRRREAQRLTSEQSCVMGGLERAGIESSQPTLGANAIQSLLTDVYKEDEGGCSDSGQRTIRTELHLPRPAYRDASSAAAQAAEDKAPDTFSQRLAFASTLASNQAFREKAKAEAEARRRYMAWERTADAESVGVGWRDELNRREREALSELMDAASAIDGHHRGRRNGTTSRPPPAMRRRMQVRQHPGRSTSGMGNDDEEVGVRVVRKAQVRQIV